MSTRGQVGLSATTVLLVLGLLAIGTAEQALAQSKGANAAKVVATSKVRARAIVGAWGFNLRAVEAPNDIRMVETLNFGLDGKGSWVMVPTNKTHKKWKHIFTWFAGDGLVVISLASLKTAATAVASKDTMYATVSADRKSLVLTSEPGRVERFDRKAGH